MLVRRFLVPALYWLINVLEGKGISDQDRNILSNQLLILGFLRAAKAVLKQGPIPEVHRPRRKKKPNESDDEDEMDGVSDMEEEQPSQPISARGTVLITLRNVPPYTLW
jgi:25S rRNA (uracil2634-N3)-methyltransferase